MLEEIYNMLRNIENTNRFIILNLSNSLILIDLMTFNSYILPETIIRNEHLGVNDNLCRNDLVQTLVFLNDILSVPSMFGEMDRIYCKGSIVMTENEIKKCFKNIDNINISKKLYYDFFELVYKFINKKPTIHSKCRKTSCKWRYFCTFDSTQSGCVEIKSYLFLIIENIIECYLTSIDYSKIKQKINNLHLQVKDFL